MYNRVLGSDLIPNIFEHSPSCAISPLALLCQYTISCIWYELGADIAFRARLNTVITNKDTDGNLSDIGSVMVIVDIAVIVYAVMR